MSVQVYMIQDLFSVVPRLCVHSPRPTGEFVPRDQYLSQPLDPPFYSLSVSLAFFFLFHM